MKLNNKGYLIVEIIVSFVIVMAIAFFLIQLTSKFLSQNDDTYVETALLTDKALMTTEVMNDINTSKLIKLYKPTTNCVYLMFAEDPDKIDSIDDVTIKKIQINTNIFSYGNVLSSSVESLLELKDNKYEFKNSINNCEAQYEQDYYIKQFSDKLDVNDLIVKTVINDSNIAFNSQLTINIPAFTSYSTEDYGIKLVIPYSPKELSYKVKNKVTITTDYGNVESPGYKEVEMGDNVSFNVSPINDEYEYSSYSCSPTTSASYSNNIFSISGIENKIDCKVKFTKKEVNRDTSGANAPKLVEGMIPVYYDSASATWKKADSENKKESYQWYDYNSKMWANIVLVSSDNRANYKKASMGTTINNSDILAFYVWIPRYKYKVWNINRVIDNDSYDAYKNGIDIAFESGTSSTGGIKCSYNYSVSATETIKNESCTISNNDYYYDHPAFWWDIDSDNTRDANEELTGFWIGKFEASSSSPTSAYGGGNTSSLSLRYLPNVRSWTNINISNIYTVARNMQSTQSTYGLPTTRNALNAKYVDSHAMKNMEWGALVYITHSKYGNLYVRKNNNKEWDYSTDDLYITTGCGPTGLTNYEPEYFVCNAYNTDLGILASTTGTIYGVYDANGGFFEYVMSNVSSIAGTFQFSPQATGFSSMPALYYIDRYANTNSYGNKCTGAIAFNRSKLGDAFGETTVTGRQRDGWFTSALHLCRETKYYWLVRGGTYDNENTDYSSGLVSSYETDGDARVPSFRTILS